MNKSAIQTELTHAIRCHESGDIHQADKIYQHILVSDPDNVDALHYSGVIAMQTGNPKAAIQLIGRAIALCPDRSVIHSNLALAYKENDQFQPALNHYKQALTLNPNNPVIYFNIGALCQSYNQFEDARAAYEQSLRLNPNQDLVHHNLGNLFLKQGDVRAAIQSAQNAMQLSPEDPKLQSNYLFSLNYSIDHSPEMILDEHLKWGQKYAPVHKQPFIDLKNQKIRIGYVSPDFRSHPVATFMDAILRYHDSSCFDIYCYSNVKRPDHVTNRIKQLKVNWRDIFYLNDHAVCDLIQSDGIDILVDLAGHSSDNCLMVFARQPAPIQITYLGYPGTTGLSQVHYRLVDKHSDPDLTKYCGSEKRLHLPYGFLCYTPSEDAPLISQKAATKQVTFGSFNNLPKVNDRVIALWSKILKAKPDSQLLLKTYGFNDGVVQERYLAGFHQHGIDPDRIQLMGAVQDEKAHLSMYNAVDIALDTFPYNGTTTTCEALWMGVPVITLAGEHHAARVGESILFQTGLNVWIARDEAEYIQKAIYLADRPDDRVYLRQHLRDWVRQSFLCQKEQFVRAFEGIVARTKKKHEARFK